MVGLILSPQVEAKPGEQTAVWSISPKLCQIAQFLWRGHVLPRQSKKGKNMELVRTLTIAEILVFGAVLYFYLLRKSK